MDEIDLGSLRMSDRISIHTDNSVYVFLVTDPESRVGILKGGVLGEDAIAASLLCCAHDQKQGGDPQRLSVGARALFLSASTNGSRRLITSQIRRLSYTPVLRINSQKKNGSDDRFCDPLTH